MKRTTVMALRTGAGRPCGTLRPLRDGSRTIATQPLQTPIPDNPDWRRHRLACVFYREVWSAEEAPGDEGCVLLYQIICLQGTPPLTPEEQDRCMRPRATCWRNPEIRCHGASVGKRAGARKNGQAEPVSR